MDSRKDLRFPTSMFQQIEFLLEDNHSDLSLNKYLELLSITEEEYRDPQFYFNGDHLFNIFRMMEKSSTLPLPVLEVLRYTTATDLGLAGLAGTSAPTFKLALDVVLKFYPMYVPALKLEKVQHGDECWLQATNIIDFAETNYLMLEFTFGILKIMGDKVAGYSLPAIIEFEHGRGAAHKVDNYIEKYQDFFNCEVKFNCKSSKIRFPSEWLTTRVSTANEATYRYVESQLSKEINPPPRKNSLADKAKHIVLESMQSGSQLDFISLADELHMSPRTLSRKLAKEDASFNHLLNEVRIDRAKELLQQTDLSVKCVAYKIGYQNSDSFSRAFKTQTGHSPTRWKREYSECS